MNSKKITDRREHRRFKAREGSFAALKPSQAVGEITNISKGGLAVHYALYDRIVTTDHFHLKKIPCKTVSDFEIEESLPDSSISMRRCGLQFGGLTEEQKSQLDYFLHNYTVGYA